MNFMELQQKLIVGCANDEEDFASETSVFISQAEEELLRRIDNFWTDVEVSSLVTVSSSRVSVPPFKHFKHVRLLINNQSTNLVQQDEAWVREYWPEETSVGMPKYYARTSGDELLIAPAATSTFPIFIKGLRAPSALTSSAPTNILIERAGTLLFYLAMKNANLWMKAWKTASMWQEMANQETELFINESRRGRRDSTRSPGSMGNEANNLIPKVP